ncbi:MAG: hypothetical protein ACLFPL_02705 [Candidatus Nanoarchaeia archaeon]
MKQQIFFPVFMRSLLLFMFISLFPITSFAIEEYSQDSYDFIIPQERISTISTTTEFEEFTFVLKNTQDSEKTFNLSVLEENSNWQIEFDETTITLASQESEEISFRVYLPSSLGYSRIVDSDGLSKFVLDDEYFGVFNFPLEVTLEDGSERLEVVYRLEVYSPTTLPIDFTIDPSSLVLSPEFPFSVRVSANNIDENRNVDAQVDVTINGEELDSKVLRFTKLRDTIDSSFQIPPTFAPGVYDSQISIQLDQEEGRSQVWQLNEEIEILDYENLQQTQENRFSIWSFDTVFLVENIGNVETDFQYSDSYRWYERIFLTTNMQYTRSDSEYEFTSLLQPGEEKELYVSFRYGIIIVILLIAAIIIGIRTYLQYKNPLEVDVFIENVKRVKHEGIKSFKIKIGFENIRREEIDTLKVIFKMPSYLHVRDESFSITPPTKVLKGSNTYKMMWEFKRFEKGDSRILGFELVNSKGILGDIHFQDVEFEVTIKGKTSKYYVDVDTIYG